MDQLTYDEFHTLVAATGEPVGPAPLGIETVADEVAAEAATRQELTVRGLLNADGKATSAGLDALEPYRARRAVFLASGFGSRMLPITINTPKPLVRVKGRRIIDSLLDAVRAAGIEEIYVVRGYLGEEFDQLLHAYPSIRFIDNPEYATTNNISSATLADAFFRNAYAFESDLYLVRPELISRYQYCSTYLGMPVEHTDDWCFSTHNGVITKLAKGGDHCHHMFGISYWTAQDGQKLERNLPATLANEAYRQYFWDETPLNVFKENYEVRVRECKPGDVLEIDSFEELQEVDPAYRV